MCAAFSDGILFHWFTVALVMLIKANDGTF